jgi:hypothetical protein
MRLLGDTVWDAFFSQYGRLRDVQRRVIPTVHEGTDLLISAATGQIKDTGKDSIALGQDWQDKTDYGAIHSVIESRPGSQLIDDKSGNVLAEGVSYQGGSHIGLRGTNYDVVDTSNGAIRIGETGKGSAQSGWGYISNPRARFDAPASAVQYYMGFKENEWVLYEEKWLFHFGGRVRKILMDIAKQKNECIESATDFYVKFAGPEFVLDWMDNISRANVENVVIGNLKSYEHKLGLPYASSQLPDAVRKSQILEWLDIDNEILAFEGKEISEPTKDQKEKLCLLLN